jgi:prepilin-type N-terminal cleavage/methylation domain-containing protein
MNTDSRGFTLIEILVVIAIIAILAGLLFKALPNVTESGRRQKAMADAQLLAQAVKSYRATYGKWPGQTQGDTDRTCDGEAHGPLLDALTNNPRGLVLLEAPDRLIADGRLTDPWGRAYLVAMDDDNDGRLRIAATNDAAILEAEVDDTAAVASWGPPAGGPVPRDTRKRVCSWIH